MTQKIQTQRRWLRSVIAASSEPLPNFPWMRDARRRPAALAEERPAAPAAMLPRQGLFSRHTAVAAR